MLEEEWAHLETATEENHMDVLRSLENEIPTWAEADQSRRHTLVSQMRTRWRWDVTVDEVLSQYAGATPPTYAPRLIGHRGSRKHLVRC